MLQALTLQAKAHFAVKSPAAAAGLSTQRQDALAAKRELRAQASSCTFEGASFNQNSINLRTVLQAWSVIARLLRISIKVRDVSNRASCERRETIRLELQSAYRTRQFSKCWQCCRSLVSTMRGAMRKWGKMTITASPSADEVVQFVFRADSHGY